MAVVEPCACTDDDEKLAVYKRIRDDYDIFQFFLQMACGKEINYDITLRKWPTINLKGYITPAPAFYFYLIGIYSDSNGSRRVVIGVINWVRGICGKVDVYFQIYPVKSVYVDSHQKYIERHTHVEHQLRINYICDSGLIFFR